MSKAEISAAEARHEELVKESQKQEMQVYRTKAMVLDLRRTKTSTITALGSAKEEKAGLKAVLEQTRQRLAESTAERDALLRELAECEKELEAERASVNSAKAAKKGLVMAQAALGDVHEELLALSSDEAKKAALEVAGGDLPIDLVPAPVTLHLEPEVDPEALWSQDPAHPLRDEIRQAFQSELVLIALQKSLSVRAAEMREGLRQLGFAHGAMVRTEELCKVATGDQSGNESKTAEFQAEQDRIAADRDSELGTLAKLKVDHRELQSRQSAVLEKIEGVDGVVASLREKCRAKREAFETVRLANEELVRAHEDAGREVEARQTALQGHPDEAARRTSAAERLARMAEEQTQRSLEELQQTQEQLISFQQAHRTLQHAHALLGEQLLAEKKASSRLKVHHERQEIELEALARNYMAALPPLPGIDKLVTEPDPPAPEKPAGAETPSHQAEKAALGRTPEPPQQPRYLDPTGQGALSAGGRLVLSI